jgi:hypothetical protein
LKTGQGVLLAAGGLLLYSLLRKGAGVGTLNFFADKVRSIDFDGLTPVMVIGLGVQNTSNQSYTLRSFAGNLWANGNYIGNLSSFSSVTIPPNSQRVVFITARLALIGIVNDVINAFQNKNFSQLVEVKAMANVDSLQVPVNIKYQVGL